MAGAHQPPQQGRIKLHHWLIGCLAQVYFIWLLFCVGGLLPWLMVQSIRAGHAREIALLLPLVSGLCVASYWQLRQRPSVYASEHGLDLEWVWGKKRHLQWEQLRNVQEISSFWNTSPRFRLGLSHGSISFYARRDFAERIQQLKLTRPTG